MELIALLIIVYAIIDTIPRFIKAWNSDDF